MQLSLDRVSKSYGDARGLCLSSLEIGTGEMVGLLGPNGSGKSTMLRLAAGLLTPTTGTVNIDRKSPREQKGLFAFVSSSAVFPEWMTTPDVSRFMAGLFPDFSTSRYDALIQKLDVTNRPFKALSRGNQTKLLLAATLAREAKLYLLDEPLAGIDFMTRESIIDAVLSEYRSDATVVLSTHEVKDAESLFDRVVILREGEVVLDANAEALRASGTSVVETYRSSMQ